MSKPTKFNADDERFYELAFRLRSSPRWMRKQVINEFAAFEIPLPRCCAKCTRKNDEWSAEVDQLADTLVNSFDEYSDKWLQKAARD